MTAVVLLACLLQAMAAATADLSAVMRQARLLIRQEKFAQALELLNGAETKDKGDSRYLYLRGYVSYRLKQYESAQADLKASIAKEPPGFESRYTLARIAESEGRKLEALKWLEPCAKAEPPVEDAPTRLSKLYWDLGRVEQARQWTTKAILRAPWDGALHYRLGRIYQQTGDEARAKDEFAQSAKSKSADSQGVRDLMECSRALASGDKAAAEQIRGKFLKIPMLDPDLLVALGTSFATAGDPEQALDLYRTASERDPTLFPAQFNLGLALLHVKQPVAALTPLQISVKIAPESKGANAALALAYVMQERYKDAIAPLEAARSVDPQDRKTAGLLSVAYYRSGSPEKAIPILRQMLPGAQDDAKIYFLLVDCLNAAEKQQEALTIASEAADRFPQLGKSWLSKGQQLARIGKYHEAVPCFAKAVELEPAQTEALLGLGDAEQKDGRYEVALDAYRRAVASGADVSAQLGEARCLMFLGRLTEARQTLEQSAQADRKDSRVHAELSRVYARLGQRDLAAEEMRIVQQLRAQEGPGR